MNHNYDHNCSCPECSKYERELQFRAQNEKEEEEHIRYMEKRRIYKNS